MEDIVEIEDNLEASTENMNAQATEDIEGVRQSTDGSQNGVSTTTEIIAPTKAKKATIRKFCQEWVNTGPWGKGNGCKTIMKSAIRKHRKSKEHVWAATKHYNEGGKWIKAHAKEVISKNRHRVITVVKLAYFNAKEDLAIRKYEGLCGLAYSLNVEEMPIRHDYSSYTNMMAGKEFIFCISEYLDDLQKQKLLKSPYYELMVDETTDRSLEKHLIIYFSFLAPKGFQSLLKEMHLQVLEVLNIHEVRWLARDNVMERLMQLMPAILSFWKDNAKGWYDKLWVYKVLFCIYMLANLLRDLNALNTHFQKENVDIPSISAEIEVTVASLKWKFLEQEFGKGTRFLKKFMDATKDRIFVYVSDDGREISHQILYAKFLGNDANGLPLDREGGDVQSCINFAKRAELLSFTDTLYYGCEGMNMSDACYSLWGTSLRPHPMGALEYCHANFLQYLEFSRE
ncbi:hypothetical protein L7F22_031823 [Adiantum nelumboides]|nr:hypothetical protein [Adiantum nelumboides]